MTRIGTVANAIGLQERDGERGVLMAMVDGRPRHAYLGNALELEIDDVGDALYVAAGLFRDGSLQGNTGRSTENLTRVLWLAFDADLLDFLGYPPDTDDESKAARKAMLDELGRMPQDELNTLIDGLRADLEDAFRALGLPMHRLDYTGYGLCAYIYLAEDDQTRVLDAKAAHKLLVGRINQHAGGEHLVDPKVNDGGTRVTRLPESTNHKGAIARLVQSLIPYTGETAPLGVNPEVPRAVGKMIPTSGPGLSQPDAQSIIDAIRPSWTLGQKHAMGLAVAGMLAKGGVPEDQALAIIDTLSVDDTKPYDRRAAVASTYRRARQGAPIAGYTQLTSLMPAAAVAFVDGVLGRYRQAASTASGPVSVGMFEVVGTAATKPAKARTEDPAFSPTPIPDAARYGWIGEYINLVEPTTEAPDAFHLACGLTLIGACIGRRVAFLHASERMLPNFYTLLIGPSGRARKDTAIKRSLALPMLPPPPGSLMVSLGIPFRVTRDVSSAEGLISRLAKHPNLYFYVTEFAKLMHNATRESTSSISPTLMEAFDGPPTLQNNVKKDEDSREAINPFLSIMAAVQPEILSQLIGDSQQYSGFLNRWLLVVGDGKGPRPNPPNLDEVAGWNLMRRATDAIGSYTEGTVLRFDPSAVARWDAWYVETYPQGDTSSQEDAMGIRLGTLVKKVALVHAVLDRAQAVRSEHLDAALATVDWSWGHTRKLLPTWGESPDARMARQIMEVLARRGPYLSKRKVQQLAGNRSGPGVFARVVKAMIENGELVVTPDNLIAIAPEAEAC